MFTILLCVGEVNNASVHLMNKKIE